MVGRLIALKLRIPLGLSRGVELVELDGAVQPDDQVPLTDDGQTHEVRVVLGEKPAPRATVESESETTSSESEQPPKANRIAQVIC